MAIELVDAFLEESLADGDLCCAVGEDEAGVLERADRCTEGVAFADVLDRPLQRRARGGDAWDGDRESFLG